MAMIFDLALADSSMTFLVPRLILAVLYLRMPWSALTHKVESMSVYG